VVDLKMQRFEAGNAFVDSLPYRDWLVGHFVDEHASPIRNSSDVEIKCSRHAAGDVRPDWVRGEVRTCIVLLVSGRFRIMFSDEHDDCALLAEQGDYAIWGPNVDHRWAAEDDSVVVTVRWPSLSPA
jgi:hypothetical protein